MQATVALPQFKYAIDVQRATTSKLPKVDMTKAFFGAYISDHMFIAHYANGQWGRGQIMPYGSTDMGPAASALNYGQSIFEGMKAFRDQYGKVQMFRPLDHFARFNKTAARMCMATVPEDMFMAGLIELLHTDAEWCPTAPGSLYIRPVMYATDEVIGVRPGQQYTFAIVTSPVLPLYTEPLKALASDTYVRAAEGGVGAAKCAGNYAAAMLAGKEAADKGYKVVVWLDAKERKFLEEFSTMNAFVVIDGEVRTPGLEKGTILDGITRNSVMQILREEGFTVKETPVSIDDIISGIQSGRLTEAFGTGTAAVITPLRALHYKGTEYNLPDYSTWKAAPRALDVMERIRAGTLPDSRQWMWPI